MGFGKSIYLALSLEVLENKCSLELAFGFIRLSADSEQIEPNSPDSQTETVPGGRRGQPGSGGYRSRRAPVEQTFLSGSLGQAGTPAPPSECDEGTKTYHAPAVV